MEKVAEKTPGARKMESTGSVEVIGVSGSPRRGNTLILLERALEGARSFPSVKTKLHELRKLKIEPCIGCFRCSHTKTKTPCPTWEDDMERLYAELARANGLILATPVYYGTVSGLLKNFMDRTEPLSRYGKTSFRAALKDKVGGGIAVGANRNGGQETTLLAIQHFFFVQDLIVVGTSTAGVPGCYLGAAATTYPEKGRNRKAVEEDRLGMNAAYALGRRVAEVASWVKAGKPLVRPGTSKGP
jgi:multimeric flavodoxin WrbA